MPVLPNSRHELFAQELAKGQTQAAAYAAAGYVPSDPGASRLASSVKVRARIDELKERAAARVEVSIASVTENLMRIAQKAEALSEASGLSVARASHMDVAKLNGLVTDKKEFSGAVELTEIKRTVIDGKNA